MAKSAKSKRRRQANDYRRAANPQSWRKSKQKPQKLQANSSPTCYLLRLPRELRDAIFNFGNLLPKRRMIEVSRDRQLGKKTVGHSRALVISMSQDSNDRAWGAHKSSKKWTNGSEVKIALFQVCRQLRTEALEFICDSNTFNFQFCIGVSRTALRNGYHKPHDTMILLQPHFIEFLGLIRYMRLDICQESVDICGTQLTSHLARHAHRLEKLTIWS